jgi:hypothetical protein
MVLLPEVASEGGSPSRAMAIILRVASPIWRRVRIASVLEVPDRRTEVPRHVTLVPHEIDGTWYLLSNYGATE